MSPYSDKTCLQYRSHMSPASISSQRLGLDLLNIPPPTHTHTNIHVHTRVHTICLLFNDLSIYAVYFSWCSCIVYHHDCFNMYGRFCLRATVTWSHAIEMRKYEWASTQTLTTLRRTAWHILSMSLKLHVHWITLSCSTPSAPPSPLPLPSFFHTFKQCRIIVFPSSFVTRICLSRSWPNLLLSASGVSRTIPVYTCMKQGQREVKVYNSMTVAYWCVHLFQKSHTTQKMYQPDWSSCSEINSKEHIWSWFQLHSVQLYVETILSWISWCSKGSLLYISCWLVI